MWKPFIFLLPVLGSNTVAQDARVNCPGYNISNIVQTSSTITADLTLAGNPCNVYSDDLIDLKLLVEYQTDSRLHVKIYDAAEQVYQIPTSILSTPIGQTQSSANQSDLIFTYTNTPFTFAVQRRSDGETLFNTSGTSMVFESQYVRLRTTLPSDPNIYGLGETSDSFRLETDNYYRTLWNIGISDIPTHTSLYGSHPIYIEMRDNQAHGVFLSNSNGMDIIINQDTDTTALLEYNTIGGVLDFYFLAGPAPADVARQYAGVVGTPAQQSYWTYGFHQCKYGYQDIMWTAEVVYNYSQAGIPLETMWNDIDYMDLRRTWTVDPDRFPIEKMQEFITYLHDHDQHYMMMVDPPISVNDSASYNAAQEAGVILGYDNGTEFWATMWPGAVVFVDWLHPNSQSFWSNQIATFFNDTAGVAVDGMWIDMNDPADFCNYPCPNPVLDAALSGTMPPPPPPIRTTWDPLPGFPVDFQPPTSSNIKREPGTGNTLPRFSTEPQVTYAQMPKRDSTNGNMTGLPNRNLLYPSYEMAHSPQGQILGAGIWPDMPHYGGYMEYDTHNLFASGMIAHSRQGLLNRRPNERPFIITRSTFAGDGNKTGHWTGDNDSTWAHYLVSIVQHIEFASIFQIPMIGTDVCGFNLNTTETLCARWAMLGAWYPFYRNHADTKAAPQEFYLWPIVTEAAKKAISTRFSLLDYLYTGFYEQTVDGSTNTVSPMFFHYPEDVNTLNISYQFFFGPSILVSPVTIEGAQNATFYLPNDTFYDFWTAEQINGTGQNIFYDNVTYTDIPVHIRGGSIIPLRQNANSVNTTAQLREQDFQLVVALDSEGKAQGNLYLDDGHSINSISSYMHFNYDNGHLTLNGTFGYQTNLSVTTLSIYGASSSNVPTYLLNKSLSAGWAVSIDGLNATTA